MSRGPFFLHKMQENKESRYSSVGVGADLLIK